jgi:hypothetical protein
MLQQSFGLAIALAACARVAEGALLVVVHNGDEVPRRIEA